MSNYPTIIDSYSDSFKKSDVPDTLMAPVYSDEAFNVSSNKRYEHVIKAACIMGIVTVVAMPIGEIRSPSKVDLYPSVSELVGSVSSSIAFPQGYEIINSADILLYFKTHPYLKSFLQSNLTKFIGITGTDNLSLEYDGIKEEGWESLYLIVHLDSSVDDEAKDNIEDALFHDFLNDAPEDIINNFTVSLS